MTDLMVVAFFVLCIDMFFLSISHPNKYVYIVNIAHTLL